MVPKGLRTWFIIHFIADYLFGIPLLIAPIWTMTFFGWASIDPATTRLVGAALLGIGGESFLGRDASVETYRAMLNLKIIWSLGAIFSIAAAVVQDAPPITWLLLIIFLIFSITWIYYRMKIK